MERYLFDWFCVTDAKLLGFTLFFFVKIFFKHHPFIMSTPVVNVKTLLNPTNNASILKTIFPVHVFIVGYVVGFLFVLLLVLICCSRNDEMKKKRSKKFGLIKVNPSMARKI